MMVLMLLVSRSGRGFCGLVSVVAKGASWMYLLTASEPERPINWMTSSEYPIRDKNCAPDTRHTCSPKRGRGSPLGAGRVSGVLVNSMA